jgi:hypothetical protein
MTEKVGKQLSSLLRGHSPGNPVDDEAPVVDEAPVDDEAPVEPDSDSVSVTTVPNDTFCAPGLAPMTFAVYGEDWFRDNTGLLTNAIRGEVRDLYIIFSSMISRRDSLEKGDFESFFRWWKTFAAFLQEVMILIDGTVIPWLEKWEQLPEIPFLEKLGGRMKVGKDIVKISAKMITHELEFYFIHSTKAVSKLCKVLSKWTLMLSEYMRSLDEASAVIVEQHCTLQECLIMDRLVANKMMQTKNYKVNIVLLVRDFEKRPQTLAFWKNQNLNVIPRLCHPFWWNCVSKDHFEYVTYFARRDSKSSSVSKTSAKSETMKYHE